MALPPGYSLRPPRMEDGPELVAMLNEESTALAGVATASLDWVTAPWTAPGVELERDFAIVAGAGGEIAGYFLVECEPPHTSVFAIGCVALGHHGRGIGAAIVREVERRGRAFAELAPPGEAVVLRLGALAEEPGVSRLLAEHGFREVRRFWAMRVLFADAPLAPGAPAGVELRRPRSGEEAAVYDCLAEAFEDHWGDGLEPKERWLHLNVSGSGAYAPGLWRVAVVEDVIVGALVAELRSEEAPELGHVVFLGVRPRARGRGIGEALLRASFAAFHEQGQRGAILHVDSESPTGATRLYERAGMRAEPRFCTWEKVLREAKPAF